MRFLVLAFIILSSQAAWSYSEQNLINFYERFYKEEMGIGFLVKKYNIRDQKLRNQILRYMKSKEWEVDNEDIEKAWQGFITTNYESPLLLQEIIENNYHDIDQAKAKFIDDLDLQKYFRIIVIPRLEKDFQLREKLTNGVITTKMTSKEKLESQKRFLAILQLNSVKELEDKYSLSQEDLDFLLISNFLLEKKSFSIYNLDLQKRIYNLKANSDLSTEEAKKYIFRNYKNRAEYLY